MREKNIQPKIYGDVKSRLSENMWQIMICNLYTDSIQQSRHNFFEQKLQNRLLMKILAENVVCWAHLPSKALITREMRLTEC